MLPETESKYFILKDVVFAHDVVDLQPLSSLDVSQLGLLNGTIFF